MGHMDRVEKDGTNRYVLPRKGDMKVDGYVYLSEDLYHHAQQPELWDQIANGCSYPKVRFFGAMPDLHLGYGVPIGSVMVTDGVIAQASVGYDINCGVLAVKTGLHASDVMSWDVRKQIIEAICQRVDMGVGTHRPPEMPSYTDEQVIRYVRKGGEAFGLSQDACERLYLPVDEDFDPFFREKTLRTASNQLGSLGKGNHFIEMQVDPKDGSVWMMVHCGSRNFGWGTANYYFHEGARVRGIDDKKRQESYLYLDEPLGREFMNAHNAAANYAQSNRILIAMQIMEVLDGMFNKWWDIHYDITHNLAQVETIDGEELLVQRKGATRAFPGNHPDLHGTKWEGEGHPCLIPGSMYSGAAILKAQEGAYDTACTVNHGSGRAMGAKAAARSLEKDRVALTAEMNETVRIFDGVPIRGIVSNKSTLPLDECDRAYKSLDAVLATLEDAEIAKVERRLLPVANIKG